MATATKTGTTHFIPNPFFDETFRRSAQCASALVQVGEDIKGAIQAASPVDTGAFRDSFSVQESTDSDGVKAVVLTDDWKAAFIEFGTVEHPFNAPIRRGIESAGYTLKGE